MVQHRQFRFGLTCFGTASREKWRATARKAEDLGYSTLSVGDHVWTGLAPLTSLMAAADATTHLRLGSLVFANDFRHPAVLAREAATIDVLSEGRLEFGIGTGWLDSDYGLTGIPLDSPKTRVSRFEEAVHVIKQLFGHEPVTFSGDYYTISGLNALPKPAQLPHPPILIGGGSRRILSIAAREANIVSVDFAHTADGKFDMSSATDEATARKIEWVRQVGGDRFRELELNIPVLATIVTTKPREAAEHLLTEWQIDQKEISISSLLESPYFLFGGEDEMVETLQMRRERYGLSYFTILGEETLDSFAPIVARLAGT